MQDLIQKKGTYLCSAIGKLLDRFINLLEICGLPVWFLRSHTYVQKRTFAGGLIVMLLTLVVVFVSGITSHPHALVVWVTMVLAFITFFTGSHNQAKRDKRNHTISILFNTREQAEYQKHLNILQNYQPWLDNKKIDWEFFKSCSEMANVKQGQLSPNQSHDLEAYQAIKYFLNYYEFISAGLCADNLDEELLFRTIRPFLTNVVHKTAPIIEEVRTEKETYPGSTKPPRKSGKGKVLCHLVYIFNRWDDNAATLSLGPNPKQYVVDSFPLGRPINLDLLEAVDTDQSNSET